jgi:Plasmid pRiA4b ORF-3-like protein
VTAQSAVLQLKVSLVGASKPPVWRRLLVPGTMRLNRLHGVLQAAMGWQDYHLHAFSAAGVDYGPRDPELDHRDERKTTVDGVIRRPGERMRYVYDFGDGWEHDIVVEEVLAAEPGARYPACLAGRGRCPPEDCGGVWGYADLRETLADPTHEEHADMLEWLGIATAADFDPDAFDPGEVNAQL